MPHPSEGVLRWLIDEPAEVPAADRDHAAGCAHCTRLLAEMRADGVLVGAALTEGAAGSSLGAADVDHAAAWGRLSSAPPAATASVAFGTARGGAGARRGRLRGLVRHPSVAALATAVVLTGAGTAAATGWLPVFRTEQVAPVSLDAADLVAVPDLTAYGDLSGSADPDVHEVPDAAAAAAETGLAVPVVAELPRGVSGDPVLQVGNEVTASFTFSADRAARAAAAEGETLPPVPTGLDGAQVRLVAGPGVAQVWNSDAGAPALIVGRAAAPQAFSSGVPFETVRDYVLSLPGVPDDVAAQLRTFTADGSTLPLPVPADEVTTTPSTVNGAPATVLTTRDRALAAVVWVDDGTLTAVAGSLDADEVLTVARELR